MLEEHKLKFLLIKIVISLANITAKVSFLSTCLLHKVIPNGFRIRFSIQSSCSNDDSCLKESVKSTLSNTSFSLLKISLESETKKASSLVNKIKELFSSCVDKQSVLDFISFKFKRILILRTKVLSGKLNKLCNGSTKGSLLDVDEKVQEFQILFALPQHSVPISSPQSQPPQDWFDLDQFPMLPPPADVRPDWTSDVIISPVTSPSTNRSLVINSPRNSSIPPRNFGSHDVPVLPSTSCPPAPPPSSISSPETQPTQITPALSTTPSSSHHTSPSLSSSASVRTSASISRPSAVRSSPITVEPFSTDNFKPLILNDVPINISPGIISLLSKGPTFSPSPMDAPDSAALEEDLMDWKERMRWAFFFRNKQLTEDPEADLSTTVPFIKPPWYSRTDKKAPIASEEVEFFMEMVRRAIISPTNHSSFSSNISSAESKAFKEIRLLKQKGFPVFLQDKASRFVIADRDSIEDKVENDLSDAERYQIMEEDDIPDILLLIKNWWLKNKQYLSVMEEDISSWLINPEARPGKLKVLIKTHKPNTPVRAVFSVCGQPVENLSSFLQFSYLGPIINSGVLQWRLRDTKELIQFIHGVNDKIKEDKITSTISLCTLDIKNMFPSIFKSLALPAIKLQLEKKSYNPNEVKAVLEALEIIRDGTRVKWNDSVVRQLDGCSLGPADSCDYCDIALDFFLQLLIPRLESSLNMKLPWIKFFRDDGLFIFSGDSQLVFDILTILNGEREELQFTTELCSCGNVLGCCHTCPKAIPYLDCLISVYQETLEDGSSVSQIKSTTYSKPTDIHHYIPPSSCTPNLSKKSPAIIKGVAHRLRLTNILDTDLLAALNKFSGYLEASGYDKATTIRFFTNILAVSNRDLAFSSKELDISFKVALVTQIHPALPNIAKVIDQYYPLLKQSPVSSTIFPRSSIISAYRKLPNLSSILANNPFSIPSTPLLPKGFHQTPGCSCKLCKEATFSTFVSSPNLPGRGYTIPDPINCNSVNVVYAVSCQCGLLYVGRTANPKQRWSNHKSHIRKGHKSCNLATHCIRRHSDIMADKLTLSKDIKEQFTFILVQSVGKTGSDEELEQLEEEWRNRLHSWAPLGLNTREDGPQRLRRKKMNLS